MTHSLSPSMQIFGEGKGSLDWMDQDPEKQPLLSETAINEVYSAGFVFDPTSGHVTTIDQKQAFIDEGITDIMMYTTTNLTTWHAFRVSCNTIWLNKELWMMMLNLSLVAFGVCVVTITIVPNPAALKVAKFTSVSKFLNVIVGLLLGFFMSSSMNRWHACVNGFMELLDSIRNLQMQFTALGVPEKETVLCLRYGFASAWLLYGQLLVETKRGPEAIIERELMWEKMAKKVAHIDRSGKTPMLEANEIEALKITRDPPGMMWMWVAALIGRLAQDGWIPPMPTPTYGRVMNLCQSAHAGIRQVRGNISMQAPLTYCHMLATLVHINNLLNAFTLGVVSGLGIATTMIAHGWHWYGRDVVLGKSAERAVDASTRESEQDLQTMLVTFLYCFFGPLLFQALLMISMQLAQPFESEDAKMPMHRLLHMLEIDMCNGRDLVDHMPFERPAFKQQAPSKPPAATTPAAAGKS